MIILAAVVGVVILVGWLLWLALVYMTNDWNGGTGRRR